jgi:uncharacterized protein (TIGR02996 family)
MTEQQALFRAVCEAPWDDLPRLVYADWLEEHGQPDRAAFIRHQCEYPSVDLRFQFHDRLPVWFAELPRLRGVKWWTNWFERGFVSTVTVASARASADHADAVFAASPVDAVEIRRVAERTLGRVLGSRYLSRLKWLCLRGARGEVAPQVADCPHLTRLDRLLIWGSFTDAGAEALAAGRYLGGLKMLSLSGHSLTDRGARALADSLNLAGVTCLVLNGAGGLSRRALSRLRRRFAELR